MSDLLLPPKVVQEIQKKKWADQRREQRAKLEAMFDFDDPLCKDWNPELKSLDPLLRLARAKPMAYEPGWQVIPGFYHWIRDNETTAATITPITGPEQSFREPDSGVLDDLRKSDLQNPMVFLALLDQRQQKEQAQEKEREERRQERQQEILDKYIAGTRTQVLTSPDVSWAQNSAGRRRRG